jgi:hypothetical protein
VTDRLYAIPYTKWGAVVACVIAGAFLLAISSMEREVGQAGTNTAGHWVWRLLAGLFIVAAVRSAVGGVRFTASDVVVRNLTRTYRYSIRDVQGFVVGPGFLESGTCGVLQLRSGRTIRATFLGGAADWTGNRSLDAMIERLNADLNARSPLIELRHRDGLSTGCGERGLIVNSLRRVSPPS